MHNLKLQLPFAKMQGIGNDYIYMNFTSDNLPGFLNEKELPDLARKISDRHFGIGSDGLILILPSKKADFRMRIFNADGSEAQMCGNGIRCVAKYIYEKGLTKKTLINIETEAGLKEIRLKINEEVVTSISVDMGKPLFSPSQIPVDGELSGLFFKKDILIGEQIFSITAIGMGNPHCVIFVNELSDELISKYGPLFENYPIFPEKTNVEFVKIKDKENIEMRVWERGSKETLACGTGACAATVASFLNGFTNQEVTVKLLGGKLSIEIDKESKHVIMTGGAEFIAEGVYFYDNNIKSGKYVEGK